MKLKSLGIEGFHCYKSVKFDFADQVTVLIGKNGAGKSSLIKAACNALTFIFNNKGGEWGGFSLSKGVPDLGVANIDTEEIHHDSKMNLDDFVSIRGVGSAFGHELPMWELKRTSQSKARLQSSLYKEAFMAFSDICVKEEKLPVFAYYSDRYPHVNVKLSNTVKEYLDKEDVFAQSWGYYHWNDFSSCTKIWQKRFVSVSNLSVQLSTFMENENGRDDMKIALDAKRSNLLNEIMYATKHVSLFADNLKNQPGEFKIRYLMVGGGAKDYHLRYINDKGEMGRWDELPAGYERLYSMVFDIAYRSYILNGVGAEPEGIVMIDELDLHLHPSLAQETLNALTQTFPKIQFIVTTHSPLVLTSLKADANNRVYTLYKNQGQVYFDAVDDIYGLDVNSILTDIMDAEDSAYEVKSQIYKIQRFIDQKLLSEALEEIDKLMQMTNENHLAVLKLRAIVSRIQIIGR